MRSELLTPVIYSKLIEKGYQFMLLKEVNDKDAHTSFVYEPLFKMPSGSRYSCTAITDQMVCNIVNNKNSSVKIYIEMPVSVLV